MVGASLRFYRALLVVGVGVLCVEEPLRADDYTILLEKRGRKNVVVVLRQQLDMERGFDRFFLEEYKAPDNVKMGYEELGAADREMLLAHGQFELYMRKVEQARRDALKRRKKKGFLPVCNLALHETGEHQEEVFEASGQKLKVKLTKGKEASVVLEAGEGKTYSLMELRLPRGTEPDAEVAHWGLMQLTALNQGKTLAVVLRRYVYPSPPHLPEEEIHFFPLRRAARHLGLKYPLKFEGCRDQTVTSGKDSL